jgi:Zn-dependent metalloprotease
MIAKEFAMGLVQAETTLPYEGQQGALFQSLGMVFASMAVQYHAGETAGNADWLLGKGIFGPHVFRAFALFSLLSPGSAYDDDELGGRDRQVAHFSEYQKTDADNGGVHINCGIPNRAFALAAKGARGKSWESVGKVWYATVSSGKLGPKTTFRKFAEDTIAHGETLFPTRPRIATSIAAAWREVGVL